MTFLSTVTITALLNLTVEVPQGLLQPWKKAITKNSLTKDVEIHTFKIGANALNPTERGGGEGTQLDTNGFNIITLTPPLYAPYKVFDPSRFLQQVPGQNQYQISRNGMSDLKYEIQGMKESLKITEIKDAMETLITGQLVLNTEKNTTTISWNRDPALTTTLIGTSIWSDPLSTPLADLRNLKAKIVANGGNPSKVFMGEQKAQEFLNHQTVKDYYFQRNLPQLENGVIKDGIELIKVFEGMEIYVSRTYGAINGVNQNLLDPTAVVMFDENMKTTVEHGALIVNNSTATNAVLVSKPIAIEEIYDPHTKVLKISLLSAPLRTLPQPNYTGVIR